MFDNQARHNLTQALTHALTPMYGSNGNRVAKRYLSELENTPVTSMLEQGINLAMLDILLANANNTPRENAICISTGLDDEMINAMPSNTIIH